MAAKEHNISVRIGSDAVDRIDALKEHPDLPRSSILRMLIEWALDNHPDLPQGPKARPEEPEAPSAELIELETALAATQARLAATQSRLEDLKARLSGPMGPAANYEDGEEHDGDVGKGTRRILGLVTYPEGVAA